MDQPVSHPNNVRPRDRDVLRARPRTNLGCGLSDDLNALHQSECAYLVTTQVVCGTLPAEGYRLAGGVQHMPQSHQVTGRHIELPHS